jgi:invasion protein IalB
LALLRRLKLLRAAGRGDHLRVGNTLEADMKRLLFAVGMLAGALSAAALTTRPALAQQSKVGDWTIEKRTQDTHCNASRGYKDKDDENRDYVIVITYSDKAIVIVMIYDGWEWDKVGEILRADVSTDDADIMKKAKWEVMDKTTVRGIFEYDQSMMDRLTKAKRLSLDFEDDDDDSIEMQIPRAGEALAALKFCEENRK